MRYTWLLWDAFAVLILVLMVGGCARKGLIRTLVSLFGYLLAGIAAGILSTPVAKFLYDNLVKDILKMLITQQIDAKMTEGVAAIGELLSGVPESLLRMIQGQDLSQLLFDGDTSAFAEKIVQEALQEPVLAILRSLCFFLLFSVALMIVRHFSRMLTGLYRIPVLGSVNTFLGGVVGALEGLFIIFLISVAMKAVIIFTGGELGWLNESVLDATYIFRFFYSFG